MSDVKRYDMRVSLGGVESYESPCGDYVDYEDYAALEAKCAAMAAENAALKQSEKEFNNFCRQEYYGWEDNFTETTATDAFLAEVRAQGVDMFALMFAEEAIKSNNITTGWRAKASRAASEYAEALREDAAQLRQEAVQ